MRETPKAKAAYEEYAALGPSRSLRKLAEQVRQSDGEASVRLRTLEEWSVQHNWQARVTEYDKERVAEKRRRREAELEQMNEEHAVMARDQALRAVQQIERLITAERFGSQASVQLFKVATDLERLARGAPTERSEQTGPDGEPLNTGTQVVFYLPEVKQREEGYDG